VVDRGFEPWLGQTKDIKIGICWFCAKHSTLSSKSKEWLVWNLLLQWASTIKIQLSVLV
jgi:hypothetical protein